VPEREVHKGCLAVTEELPSPPPAPSWMDRRAPLPRFVALSLGALAVVIVAGAFVSQVRRRRAAGADADGFRLPESAAIFVGALVALHRVAGDRALLWLDTVNEERDVASCLVQNACTSLGERTSLGDVQHAVAWLDVRALFAFAGLGVDQVHWLAQALDAAGVAIVASAACRAGGRVAGCLAAVVSVLWTCFFVNQLAVYNSVILPFLGAVLLVTATEAAERPGERAIAWPALVAAVMANVHVGCLLAGVSVVWVALLAPRDRARFAVVAALVFATATFALAPGTWIHDAGALWQLFASHHGGTAQAEGTGGVARIAYGLMFPLGVLVAIGVRRRAGARPLAIDVAAALALPMLGASLLALATSAFRMNLKYLAHIAGAGAVLCAAPIALLAHELRRDRRWLRLASSRFAVAAGAVLPYATAAFIGARATLRDPINDERITFHDVAGVSRELDRRGWTFAHAYRGLKSPGDAIVLSGVEAVDRDFRGGPSGDDPEEAYLFKVATTTLPDPLPAGWAIAATGGARTALLVFVGGALDWTRFEACDPATGTCTPSGLAIGDADKPDCTYCVPGMPSFADRARRRLELRLRARPSTRRQAILMPEGNHVCGGRVVAVPGQPPEIAADGRHASWVAPAGGEVRVAWDIGSPECNPWAYTGFPPFFVEGDAENVRRVEGLTIEPFHPESVPSGPAWP
jgi:hypothetical protein